MKNVNDFLLTKTVTVGQLRTWIATKDAVSKDSIIQLIEHRFKNRYLKHLHTIDSGFLKMAICCLMIETLESFKQGVESTEGKGIGKKMFKDFFNSEKVAFPGFCDIYRSFYSNIRCGILHQAETKKAWRILGSGLILDKTERTINARAFVIALENSLENYLNDLRTNTFGSQIWNFAITKLENICDNCSL